MAKKTSEKSTKAAKKATVKRTAAKLKSLKFANAKPRSRDQKVNSPPAKGQKLEFKMQDKSDQFESAAKLGFTARLCRPKGANKTESWTFLNLPKEASTKLPSRGQTTVAGTFNQVPFSATLEPDGEGGHWLKVEQELREAAGIEVGDVVTLEIAPVAEEPEPTVPPDLKEALATASAKVREAWSDITPAARRDFVHWIASPKRPETRVKRIETTCDMLAKGKRRPCCFDRSGMYSKSLSCPVADD